MSDPRPPLHQPPNPDDLRRAPPASPACAHVRGLLRDFADNDLGAPERTLVEEHVHVCFACSVELSRAEHEVLRLRRGFAAMAAGSPLGAVPPADFARRVVDRIVDETPIYGGSASSGAAESGAAESGATDSSWGALVPADGGAGKRPRSAASGPDAAHQVGAARHGSTRWARYHSAFVFAAAALLLACFGALAMWSTGLEREPGASARLVVMRAKGAFGTGGRLAIGDGLGESQWLQVGVGGSALFDWHDLSSGSQPAAKIEMNGRGRMRLQRGAPLLMDGTVAIETNRAVEIPVADGSTIQLGIGDYVIAADVVVAGDDYLDPMRDPMLSAPADLRIKIEVLRGDPARIIGTEVGPTLVAAGSIGVYGTSSTGVSVRPSGTQVAAGGGGRQGSPPPGPSGSTTPTLAASVHQRNGLPSVGTDVDALFLSNGATVQLSGVTNAYGSVVLTTDAPCETDFAILGAVPGQLEYGVIAPDAYPLLRDGVSVRAEQSLVLDLSEPLQGSIVDEGGQPLFGVRVVPCIVDELFGTVFRIDEALTSSSEQGTFWVRRLPATLPHYQHLVLVLIHPDLQSKVVPVPVRGGANALLPMAPIEMQGIGTIELNFNLPHGTQVTIWEEVTGLPAGVAVLQRQYQVSWGGHVSNVKVGGGDLWWVSGAAGNQNVSRLTDDGSGCFSPSPAGAQPRNQLFRPMTNLTGTDLWLGASFRHEQVVLPAAANANPFTMVATDALNRPVAHAQVFAVTPTGPRGRAEGRFLGLTSAQGVISLEPVRETGDLIVIGADGSIALINDPQDSVPRLDARLQPPGRVLLGPALRPGAAAGSVVTLRFELRYTEMLSGIEVRLTRFASEATGWEFAGLPPGAYVVQVNGQNRLLTVPADGFITLE